MFFDTLPLPFEEAEEEPTNPEIRTPGKDLYRARPKHNAVQCYMCGRVIRARRATCCAAKELLAEIDGVTVA